MEKILTTESWSFDKHLVVLQRYDRETDLTDMEFNKVTFGFKCMIYQSGFEIGG